MHALVPQRRVVSGLLAATALTAGLIAPGAADAGSPAQVAPKSGAVLALGSQPVFKVRDGSSAARRYGVYITISTSNARKRNGDLKKTSIGTFANMKRRSTTFRYKTPLYSFPTWFMARPGTYYWQAYRIDCRAARSCHVHTKIRRFIVR